MIVAFPIDSDKGLDSEISEHFGRARYFLLARLEDGRLEGVDMVPAPAHAFGAFPQFLHDLGVRVVVCNSIGNKAMEMFDNQGIIVFSNNSGEVSKALQELLPKLKEIEEKDREEEEKREKARKALEKAREKNVSFWVDVPEERDQFFISVSIGDGLVLSFDNTPKGKRVVIQRKVGEAQEEGQPTSEYESLHFYGTRLTKREKVKWWDLGDKDNVNGEIWEVVWEDDLPEDIEKKLEELVKPIYENLENPDKGKVRALNDYLKELVDRYKRVWEE